MEGVVTKCKVIFLLLVSTLFSQEICSLHAKLNYSAEIPKVTGIDNCICNLIEYDSTITFDSLDIKRVLVNNSISCINELKLDQCDSTDSSYPYLVDFNPIKGDSTLMIFDSSKKRKLFMTGELSNDSLNCVRFKNPIF